MSGGNDIIHQQHRLRIMAALESEREPLDFAALKTISKATDGNLGSHLRTLENAGYIRQHKEALGGRTRTWVALTPQGRQAFRDHVGFLEDILSQPLGPEASKTGGMP